MRAVAVFDLLRQGRKPERLPLRVALFFLARRWRTTPYALRTGMPAEDLFDLIELENLEDDILGGGP